MSTNKNHQQIETQEMMHLAVEASPNGMVLTDEDGRIVLVNSTVEALFGYNREELIGQSVNILIPERFRRQHPKLRENYYKKPSSRAMGKGRDLYALHKGGKEFPVEIGLNPVQTSHGIFVLAAIVDITDRRHAEEMMHLAVEASPNGMVMMDRDGSIILVNSTTETMFGYNREELIGQSIEMLVPERFRGDHPQLRSKYFTSPKTRAMGRGRDLHGLSKEGTEFPVEIGLNPIETRNGLVILASVVDITERKHAEEMVHLAVEASPNGMVMMERSGNIIMVNSTTEKLFGYDRGELIGQSIEMLVPARFRDQHPALRGKYFDTPKTRAMGQGRDLYGLHKEGTEFPIEIGLNPIETRNGLVILASIVDITERKQREEQLKAAVKEKDALLAEIHHRVKNNLQIIDSLLGMQSDQVVDQNAASVLAESQNRVKSMALIHQTLYESQDFSQVEISDVIRNLVNHLCRSYALDTSRIAMQINVDKILLPIDISIPLGLIINELCSNAIKHAFNDSGSGEINISLLRSANDQVELTVSDNGSGIPEGFDIENTTSLGLQLIQVLSEQIFAELWIQRANPTCFRIQFPTQPPA